MPSRRASIFNRQPGEMRPFSMAHAFQILDATTARVDSAAPALRREASEMALPRVETASPPRAKARHTRWDAVTAAQRTVTWIENRRAETCFGIADGHLTLAEVGIRRSFAPRCGSAVGTADIGSMERGALP